MKAKLPNVFTQRPLFSDGFVCMLRKGHPVLQRKRFTLQRYLALEHLVVAPGGTAGNSSTPSYRAAASPGASRCKSLASSSPLRWWPKAI